MATRDESKADTADTQLELGTRNELQALLPEGKLYYRIGEVSRSPV